MTLESQRRSDPRPPTNQSRLSNPLVIVALSAAVLLGCNPSPNPSPVAMTYHGGNVMVRTTSYVIFWMPNLDPSTDDGRKALLYQGWIRGFFQDEATSASTGYFNIHAQYCQTLRSPGPSPSPFSDCARFGQFIQNRVSYGGDYPSATAYSSTPAEIIQEAIGAHPEWAPDPKTPYTHAFFLFLGPSKDDYHWDSDDGRHFQAKPSTCASGHDQHNGFTFAVIPYADPSCSFEQPDFATLPSPLPANSPSDPSTIIAISAASHEQAEMITDPQVPLASGAVGGWWAGSGDNTSEIGDLCNQKGLASQSWNGRIYMIQKLWSNHSNNCVSSEFARDSWGSARKTSPSGSVTPTPQTIQGSSGGLVIRVLSSQRSTTNFDGQDLTPGGLFMIRLGIEVVDISAGPTTISNFYFSLEDSQHIINQISQEGFGSKCGLTGDGGPPLTLNNGADVVMQESLCFEPHGPIDSSLILYYGYGSNQSVRITIPAGSSPGPVTPTPTANAPTQSPTPSSVAFLPNAYIGTWTGTFDQKTAPAGSYPMTLTLRAGAVGTEVGETSYPSLTCSGVLALQDVNAQSVTVLEVITTLSSSCISATYVLSVSGQTLTVEWTDPITGSLGGNAILSKAPA